MGAARMLHQWTRSVRSLVPDLHGHQLKTLTLMALSMCCSGLCQITRMVLDAPVPVKIASTRRRFERFLANDRVDPVQITMQLARSLMQPWQGQTIRLFIDETALGPWLLCMKVSVGYRGRALPLAWVCYEPGKLPATQPEIVELLLRQMYQCLPRDAKVVLMADRGLSWPLLIDLCEAFGWEYLLRVQGQTMVKHADGTRHRIDRFTPRRGSQWLGRASIFQDAGWRRSNIVAVWERDRSEPWLLVTSLPARLKRCNEYRSRMWQEEAFRDEKSHGFHWQRSRVRRADHADRLLLVMLLATWMTIIVGAELIRRGQRALVEATSRPSLSVFQLGYRAWCHLKSCMMPRGPTLQVDPASATQKCVG
jgi:hypothetical protein